MITKKCRRCGFEKTLDEYYKHSGMKDGRLNICIGCKKKDTRIYSKTESGKRNERKRNSKPARKASVALISKKWRIDNPEKYKAHTTVNNALRDGKIICPERCEQCGSTSKLHAHHEDYSKPLKVNWLCVPCHGTKNPNFIK